MIKQSMSEKYKSPIKKIACAYHPSQFLTNFCAHNDCLMPLCPTCIVDHTEEHYQEYTHPVYENLQEAVGKAKNSCLQNLNTLENLETQLRGISYFRQGLRKELHSELSKAKDFFYNQITKIIERYEKEMFAIIMQDYSSNGLYHEEKFRQHNKEIKDLINQLYEKLGMLKGEQCLAALIKYKSGLQHRVKQIEVEVSGNTTQFKKSKLEMTIDQQVFKEQISKMLDDILSIKTVTYESPPRSSRETRRQQMIQKYSTPEKVGRISPASRKRIFEYSKGPVSPTQKPNSSVYLNSDPRNASARRKNYDYVSMA